MAVPNQPTHLLMIGIGMIGSNDKVESIFKSKVLAKVSLKFETTGEQLLMRPAVVLVGVPSSH